jgi:hypothetical protein
VRCRASGSNDDEQRDHREDGQGSKAQGPVHELELPGAPVKVLDPQVVPDPLGAPERRALHGQVPALACLPVDTAVAPQSLHAIAWLDSVLEPYSRHASNMIVASSLRFIPLVVSRAQTQCYLGGSSP